MNTINAAAGPGTTPERATFFLPAPRSPREEVLRQHALLAGDPVVAALLESTLSLTMILNSRRQAVLINESFRARLGLVDAASAVGARLGEYLDCARAGDLPHGCGTTPACRDCGAAKGMACALAGRPAVNPCRIQGAVCGQDLTLMLRATPFRFGGEDFMILSATDIEHEVRRREMEQIFFHDVLNTASGVQGLLHYMQDCPDDGSNVLPIARKASDTLIDELLSQRDLASAENGELKTVLKEVAARPLLAQLAGMLASHPLAKNRRVTLAPDAEEFALSTDETLLSRVLVNLIKNALEAAPAGSEVTVSCRRGEESAVFLVHNPGCMPLAVQHQVFQRSFSTKGAGRGLGTYSVRLLTENYLGGAVSFTSDPAQGTTFRAAFPLKNTRS